MIDQRLVASALIAVDTANFERFAQTFYGAIQDREFVPLGGVHDGGAEGYDANGANDLDLFTDESATSFLQVSKQVTTRAKIRGTVKRLREYGRTPKVLTYVTSQEVKDIDKEERALTDELKCRIAIRDSKYIELYINSSNMTQGAFYSYLQPFISQLYSPGVSDIGKEASKHLDRTLAVFLRQEVENRKSRSTLIESVSDSLIIWSLRDSDADPRTPKLISRDEILKRIELALPTSKSFIRGVLDHRLRILSSKDAPGGRFIRAYKKTDEYSLPYETRIIVAVENADDDLLKIRVSCAFEDRLTARTNEDVDKYRSVIVETCHSALEQAFEHQGLKLAQFAVDDDVDDELFIDVSAIATNLIDKLMYTGDIKSLIRRHVVLILRGTFYTSSEVERRYLEKLSRTYILLMLLKAEPKIVDYFSKMAGSFNLYVGSDIIIRALSELYLNSESQTTLNLLKILKDAGSNLILTEITVEEVATHIRRQMYEFRNVYENNENRMTLELVEYVSRLLIRSYFYSKLAPADGVKPPSSWRAYIGTFCNFGDILSNRGDTELANYLISKLGFSYEATADTSIGIDQEEMTALTASIRVAKQGGGVAKDADELLAEHDAMQVLRIYARRAQDREESPGNPFGFKTWWLTQDGKVRRAAKDFVTKHGGKRFMMRPELLLNYIGLSPTQADVHRTYQSVFPTALGVRLSSGIREKEFRKVMRDASELNGVDDARAEAMVIAMTARLTNDATKQFDTGW